MSALRLPDGNGGIRLVDLGPAIARRTYRRGDVTYSRRVEREAGRITQDALRRAEEDLR